MCIIRSGDALQSRPVGNVLGRSYRVYIHKHIDCKASVTSLQTSTLFWLQGHVNLTGVQNSMKKLTR